MLILLAASGCSPEALQEEQTHSSPPKPAASSPEAPGPSADAEATVRASGSSGAQTQEPPAGESSQGRDAVYMRAVWVATVLNIDFPSSKGDPEAQKAEFEQILDNTLAWNLDTVIVQVRPMGDALYASSLNPWSSFLTGTQGQDPGWDPLAFMVDAAHERGISLHVWLNPYRVTHTAAGFTAADLAEESLAKQHPEWLIEHENMLFYDPAREEVKAHITDTVREIVDGYDVDGVHFDDYFYPADYPLPDGAERDGILDRERRANVTDMLRRVHEVCRQAGVVFGVSPFGIWKNASSDPAGSDTGGNESYYSMAADSVTWIREGIVDYIAPQLYWPVGHELADYRTLLAWWSGQVEGTGVSLVIGQGTYDESVRDDIVQELVLNENDPMVTGSIFFSYSDLADNPQTAELIRTFFEEHPLADTAAAA